MSTNPQKQRRGLQRIWHAAIYSLSGIRIGWSEPAFRQESVLAMVLVPIAFWLGQTWTETAVLAGSVLAVLVVELLNTAVEKAVDRIGHEWNTLSGQAKDLGSAAVLLSVIFCICTWAAACWHRFV